MTQSVLVVEDDAQLGGQIVTHLRDAGYATTWLRQGRALTGDDLAQIDLVVVDLMLPGVPGMEMIARIRELAAVPILVLSARNETVDKVRALQIGADDYMTKPFWPEELVERVRARLRRPALADGNAIELAGLRIDRRTREVSLDGRPLELTRVEFEFLLTLAERPGAAITRRVLVQRALDPDRDGDARTLDVHASRLRKKLGNEKLIETVWGIGYRLAARPPG